MELLLLMEGRVLLFVVVEGRVVVPFRPGRPLDVPLETDGRLITKLLPVDPGWRPPLEPIEGRVPVAAEPPILG